MRMGKEAGYAEMTKVIKWGSVALIALLIWKEVKGQHFDTHGHKDASDYPSSREMYDRVVSEGRGRYRGRLRVRCAAAAELREAEERGRIVQ
jgi:hypothetical protein